MSMDDDEDKKTSNVDRIQVKLALKLSNVKDVRHCDNIQHGINLIEKKYENITHSNYIIINIMRLLKEYIKYIYIDAREFILKKLRKKYCRDRTLLECALYKRDVRAVKILIEGGLSVNIRFTNLDTPLIISSLLGMIDLVEWLLLKGANAKAKNYAGATARSVIAPDITQERVKNAKAIIELLDAQIKKENK